MNEPIHYSDLLRDIKDRIQKAQVRATMAANAELLMLYWDVGRIITERQNEEGWGSKIIQRLANGIRNEFSEIKGFSERNLKRMQAFYREYRDFQFGPTPLAQIPGAAIPAAKIISDKSEAGQSTRECRQKVINYVFRLPWAHNVALLGIKDLSVRLWYMEHALEHGWSHDWLVAQIKSCVHNRQGHAITNFADRLPAPNSVLAQDALKDPYIFDFLTLEEPYHEKEIEAALVANVEKFLLELGTGFAFMGRQYHLDVGEHDFYIDLLFYHTRLHCYVVIELKKGAFKPEYAGKVNFYCSVVDDYLKQDGDNPTIGLILCQTKDRFVAEYTLKGTQKPIGISEYELTRFLPDDLKSMLPSIASIEERLDEMSKKG